MTINVYNNSDNTDQSILTDFYGYKNSVYLDPFISGRGFVFVTKPSLFIYPEKPSSSDNMAVMAYENMCKDPFFSQYILEESMNQNDRSLIRQLSYATFSDTPSYFLPIFTNLAKNSDLVDVTLDRINSFQTRTGYSLLMPNRYTASKASSTMALSVTETANSDFTKMISLWVNYINNMLDGTFSANPVMTKNNVLDYASSIYVFIIGPDGRTIKHYCRYTGCYPSGIPYSALNSTKGNSSPVDLSIQFNYMIFDADNPMILKDFNAVSLKLLSNTSNTAYVSSDEAYKTFMASASSVDYDPILASRILDPDKLGSSTQAAQYEASSRDPLALVETIDDHKEYILSFGSDTLVDKMMNDRFGSDGTEDLLKV